MQRNLVPTLLIAAGLLGAGSAALAGRGERDHHGARAAQALLTPEQATTIAEVRAGGRVVRSRFDHATEQYRFELASDSGATRRVSVDAAGGALRSIEDATRGERP